MPPPKHPPPAALLPARPLNCSLLAVEDAPALLEAVLAGLVGAVQPQQLLLVGDPVHCRPALEVAAHGPRNFIDSPGQGPPARRTPWGWGPNTFSLRHP